MSLFTANALHASSDAAAPSGEAGNAARQHNHTRMSATSASLSALKRSPLPQKIPSSSLLSGFEIAIPTRKMLTPSRTPSSASSSDDNKPLPPIPLAPRRKPASLEQSSYTPSSSTRRTSSIYSRTHSQWMEDPASNSSIDLADHPLPTLQPIAYSSSTPQLLTKGRKRRDDPPRAFEPLIAEPSPFASREGSASPPPLFPFPPQKSQLPSVLLPLPTASAKILKKHLHTVSLEKAQETAFAAGAPRYLPEELRAKKAKHRIPGIRDAHHIRARSDEHVRLSSVDMFGPNRNPIPPQPQPSSTMVDRQGRERLVEEPGPRAISTTSTGIFRFGFELEFEQSTRHKPARRLEQGSAAVSGFVQEHGSESARRPEDDMERGRTRHRWSRDQQRKRYSAGRDASAHQRGSVKDAQKLAAEYASILDKPYTDMAYSPFSTDSDGSANVKSKIKLVPQPLFQPNKKSQDTRHDGHSAPTIRAKIETTDSHVPPGRYSDMFGLRLSRSPKDRDSRRRQSSSGSIPISPPSFIAARNAPNPLAIHPAFRNEPVRTSHKHSRSNENQAASFSDATHRRTPSAKDDGPHNNTTSTRKQDGRDSASSSHSPEAFSEAFTSPKRRSARTRVKNSTAVHLAGRKSGHSQSNIHHRVGSDGNSPVVRALAASPHLYPRIPSGREEKPALGWSDKAKSAFDSVRDTITTQAKRSLEERRSSRTSELETPAKSARQPRLLGNVLEGWRESKANKRREVLKRMIKVVPEQQQQQHGERTADDDRRAFEVDSPGGKEGTGGNGMEESKQSPKASILQGFSSQTWDGKVRRVGG